MKPNYVFIPDELSEALPFLVSDEPTPEDVSMAEVRMVTIIRLHDCHVYTPHGWQPMKHGVLGQSEEHDDGPVHWAGN